MQVIKSSIRASIMLLLSCAVYNCTQVTAPKPIGPLPSESQLEWHEMEFYMFVHFNMNTFTNMEWGLGDELPEKFNPTELDCRQWARIASEAGMKGIILTAKHHDGFCLWPSRYTEHSVKNSPWKDGQGDVVKELADACKEFGLKMGLYLSPWDRNHGDYGTEKYITYYRNQIKELLTNYGQVFEFWVDGANGGTGYYGGANENRRVDRKTYYDWTATFNLIQELQPGIIIFSDAGPGCRWVGNERGWAGKTNWSLLRRDEFSPGVADSEELISGQEDGTHWVPAEIDVSIRPGWYYHTAEDEKVHTLDHLLDIYYHSVGRNGNLLLNFPVDTRGLIHERDVEQVMKLSETLNKDFENDLAIMKKAEASNVRGKSRKFGAGNVLDGQKETYWCTDDGITTASLTIDLGEELNFNRFLIQEYIRMGQRVSEFTIDAFSNGEWEEIASETTIGYKRILRLPDTKASKIRLNIKRSKACPLISNIEVYNAPV
jgi:alpha-L-fucosidase